MNEKNSTVELRQKLRDHICDLLQADPFLGSLSHTDIAEALVNSAFAFSDFNGGLNDTCHAAKVMHQLVDEAGQKRHDDYSPEKLKSYTKQAKTA